MKKFLLALSLLFLTTISLAQDQYTNTEVGLYTVAGVGAAASFMFWLPETMHVIRGYGFSTAIVSTHIPRLCIDVATIALVVYNMRKKEKQRQAPKRA